MNGGFNTALPEQLGAAATAVLSSWEVVLENDPANQAGENRNLVWRDPGGMEIYRETSGEPGSYFARFEGLLEARICPDAKRLGYHALLSTPDETVNHLLADQIIPRVLAHDGQLIVHAGVLEQDGKSLLVMGESGRGKSTLSASLASAGWILLGDDAALLDKSDEGHIASAVYPSLRLLPDSRGYLFPDMDALRPVAHYSQKRHVPFDQDSVRAPIPVAAIVSLAEPSPARVSLRPMSKAKAAIAILASSFALDPTDKPRARRRFEQACSLADRVPVIELAYPRRFDMLPAVQKAIGNFIDQLDDTPRSHVLEGP